MQPMQETNNVETQNAHGLAVSPVLPGVVEALIAANGDAKLVAEHFLNSTDPGAEATVLAAFLREAALPNSNVANQLKALLYLQLLQLLGEVRTHLMGSMGEATTTELLKALSTVIEGINQASGPAVQLNQQFNFGDAKAARQRVVSRLQQYSKGETNG